MQEKDQKKETQPAHSVKQSQTMYSHDPDEVNLLEYIYIIVRHKWILIISAVVGYFVGYFFAMHKGPVYISNAVIAPRESSQQSSSGISSFGPFGSMIASQLNLSGGASMDKIQLLMESRSFNAQLVEEKNLLPYLIPEQWDSVKGQLKDGFEKPDMIGMGGILSGSLLEKETNKNGTMTISIEHEDSIASTTILSRYLEFLDTYIRKDIQQEAKENRDYLESQMISITDPLLQAKLQESIAKEVEKMMVVSKEAFKIIDHIYTWKSFKEKKQYPLFGAVGLFVVTLIIVIVMHVLSSSVKTSEDKDLVNDIKKNLWKLPFMK